MDTIKRFGGTTSPLAQWPVEEGGGEGDDDKFGKLEALIKKKKLQQEQGQSGDGELSAWAKKASRAVTDQLPEEKAKKARKKAAREQIKADMAASDEESTEMIMVSEKERRKKRSMVKKSLDEVLSRSYEDDKKVGSSSAITKRDIYEEVGISQSEVDAYWDRREEVAQQSVDKFLVIGYPVALIAIFLLVQSVIGSFNVPEDYSALGSLTGRA
jgi:hypothetical protein